MGSLGWWGFQVAGSNHQLKVLRIGQANQEAYLDGSLIEAPAGTITFTGPGGVLLELLERDGAWGLFVDSAPAASLGSTGLGSTAPTPGAPPVAAWRFIVGGVQHELKVISLGAPGQAVYLDSCPIPAPEGTTTFTGPAGTLLELQGSGGLWKLLVDGTEAERFNPNEDPSAFIFSRKFEVAGVLHEVRVVSPGQPGQEVFLDGTLLPAPEGQVSFTGPAGALLELKILDGEWALTVDDKVILPEGVLPQGVSFDRDSGKYQASIRVNNKFKDLGIFNTAEEAHARYLEAKKG